MGYELGAATTAVILTFGPLVLVLSAMMALTWPEIAVVPMFAVLVFLAIALPLLLYGSAYLTWQAIDIMLRPPTVLDFSIIEPCDVP